MKIHLPKIKKEKPENYLALDIGTEAVKALIFKKENSKIEILGFGLQYFDQFGVFDSKNFEIDIKKRTISKAIEEAKGEKELRTFLRLPANILRERIYLQSLKRERTKKIDQKEEREIYQRVFEGAKNEISKTFQIKSGLLPEDLKFQNLKILEIKIDGYLVEKILGFKGENLEFKILISFLPKYYFEQIAKIFSDLNLNLLEISGLAEDFKYFPFGEGIFLDIGGDLTQILILREGKIDQIFEFEIGGRSISKILSVRLGLSEREGRNLKERYSKGELSEDLRKKIGEIILPEIENWFSNLKIGLKEKSFILPSDIFLFGGGSELPEIGEILQKGEDLPFFSPPKIKILFPKDFKNIEDKLKILKSPQQISPLLLCYHGI